jgi:hypothetical protein
MMIRSMRASVLVVLAVAMIGLIAAPAVSAGGLSNVPRFVLTPTESVPGTPPSAVAVADFDGDGRPDTAAILPDADAVMVGVGDGAHRVTYPVGDQPAGIVTGDFTGDGRPDVAVTLSGDNAIAVLPNIGGGRFGPAITSPAWNDPTSLVAADLDGDGVLDLAGNGNAGQGDQHVWTLQGAGNGTFTDLRGTVVAAPAAWGIAAADFNGDGVTDLATTDGSVPGHAIVLIGRGDRRYRLPKLYPIPDAPLSLVTGDFDGDGHADIATVDPGDQTTGSVSFLFGTGDGGFKHAVSEPAPIRPTTAVAADFNGDGVDDLAISNEVFGERDDAVVYLGERSRQPRSAGSFMAGFGGGDMAAADFNGDGHTDLACADEETAWGGLAFAYGRGDGTFDAAPTFGVGQEDPDEVRVADLNGDGVQDLVTNGLQGISVLLGKRSGGFKPSILTKDPFGCCDLELADLNGDGNVDAVVDGHDSVEVLFGRGDGTFNGPVDYPTRGRSGDIAVGDLNGDGQPDLVVASSYSEHLAVLMNRGHGSFGWAKRYATDKHPFSPVIADLNGDGIPDIAVACQRSNTVSLLFGEGRGGFAHQTSIPAGEQPVGVRTADLNDDGKADLVVAGLKGIAVIRGLGNGEFSDPSVYPPDALFEGFAVTDVNGDGKLDVAVADGSQAALLVYYGRGDGTLSPDRAYPGVGFEARGLAPVDLDHGGRVDFVLTEDTYAGAVVVAMQER